MLFKEASRKTFYKVICFICIFNMILLSPGQNDLYAKPQALSISAKSNMVEQDEASWLKTFSLLPSEAKIYDSFTGDSNQMVIHIQDAHCNYYAQKKIVSIISNLIKKTSADVINLEGGVGEYDISCFTEKTTSEIRRKVSEYFLMEGTISGPEYFMINNSKKVDLWGCEDPSAYVENLQVYRKAIGYKGFCEKGQKELESCCWRFMEKTFSKELLEVEKKFNEYASGESTLKEYLGFLKHYESVMRKEIGKYSNVNRLIEVLRKEKNIDFKKANDQREELIDGLSRLLSINKVQELLEEVRKYKEKEIGETDFFKYLLLTAEKNGYRNSETDELQKYVAYIKTYSMMDKNSVETEIRSLDDDIKQNLFENSDQKKLDGIYSGIQRLNKLFGFSLSRKEYETFTGEENSSCIKKYVSFLKEYGDKYRLKDPIKLDAGKMDHFIKEALKFYEDSFKRDRKFIKNIKFSDKKYMNKNVSILVTGGFHSENLLQLLRKEEISYVSIIPLFKNAQGYKSPYFKILSGGKSDVVQDFGVIFSLIAPPSLMNALSSIAGEQERAEILKLMVLVMNSVVGTGEMISLKVKEGEYVVIDGSKAVPNVYVADSSIVEPIDMGARPADIKWELSEIGQDKVISNSKERKYLNRNNEVVSNVFNYLDRIKEVAPETKEMQETLRSLLDRKFPSLSEDKEFYAENGYSPIQIIGNLGLAHAGGKGIYLPEKDINGRVLGDDELSLMLLHELIVGVYASGVDTEGKIISAHELARSIEAAVKSGNFSLAGKMLARARKHELVRNGSNVFVNIWEMTDEERKNLDDRDYTSEFVSSIADVFARMFGSITINRKFSKLLEGAKTLSEDSVENLDISNKGWISMTINNDENGSVPFEEKKLFVRNVDRLKKLLRKSTDLTVEDIDDIVLTTIARGGSLKESIGWLHSLLSFLLMSSFIREGGNEDIDTMYDKALKKKLPYFLAQKKRGKEFIDMLLMNNMFSYGKEVVTRKELVDGTMHDIVQEKGKNVFIIAYKMLRLLYRGGNQNAKTIGKYIKADYAGEERLRRFLTEVMRYKFSEELLNFLEKLEGEKQLELLDSVINEYNNVRGLIREGKVSKDLEGEDLEVIDKNVQNQINDEARAFIRRYIESRRDITTQGPESRGKIIVFDMRCSGYQGLRISKDNVDMLSLSETNPMIEDDRRAFNKMERQENRFEITYFGGVVIKDEKTNRYRPFTVEGPEGKKRNVSVLEFNGNMFDIMGNKVRANVAVRVRENAEQSDFESTEGEITEGLENFLSGEPGAGVLDVQYKEKIVNPEVIMTMANINDPGESSDQFCIFINENLSPGKKIKQLLQALNSLQNRRNLPVIYRDREAAGADKNQVVDQIFGEPVQKLMEGTDKEVRKKVRDAYLGEVKRNLGEITDLGEIPRVKAELETARNVLIDPVLRQDYALTHFKMMERLRKNCNILKVDPEKFLKAEKMKYSGTETNKKKYSSARINETLLKIFGKNLKKLISGLSLKTEEKDALLDEAMKIVGKSKTLEPEVIKAQLKLFSVRLSKDAGVINKFQELSEAYLFLSDNGQRENRKKSYYFDVLGLNEFTDLTGIREIDEKKINDAYAVKVAELDKKEIKHRELLELYSKVKDPRGLYDYVNRKKNKKIKDKYQMEWEKIIRACEASLIGKIEDEEGGVIKGGYKAVKKGNKLIIEHSRLPGPKSVPIEEKLSGKEKEKILNKMALHIKSMNTLSAKEKRMMSFIYETIKTMDNLFIIQGDEIMGVSGVDEEGKDALFLNRLLMEDIGIMHEIVERMDTGRMIEDKFISEDEVAGVVSFQEFGGTKLSEIMSNHIFAKGVGSKPRMAYENMIDAKKNRDIKTLKDLSVFVLDLENTMQELNLRPKTGNKLTKAEKAQILYNFLTREGRKENCDPGNSLLLYGIQDHLDPSGNAAFTSKIKTLINDMRRQTVNIIVVPDLDVRIRSKLTNVSKRVDRKIKKIGVNTIILQGNPGEKIEDLLEKAYELAAGDEYKDKMPQIFVDVINDPEMSGEARDFVGQKNKGRMAVVVDDVIENLKEGDVPKINIAELMIVAGAVLNDKRAVNLGATKEDLVESRKKMIKLFTDSKILNLNDEELGWLNSGDEEGLESILQRLYSGDIKMFITRINWNEITDWMESQNQIMTSL